MRNLLVTFLFHSGESLMDKIFLRSAYNYSMDDVSEATGLRCLDLSLAVQSGKDDADINVIVRRFGLTGQLPVDLKAPMYGDFTEVLDYQSALHAVIEADAAFARMPAEVRARFHNDPGEFVDFCSKEGNGEEMLKLGLRVPAAPPPKDPTVRFHKDDLDRLVPGKG